MNERRCVLITLGVHTSNTRKGWSGYGHISTFLMGYSIYVPFWVVITIDGICLLMLLSWPYQNKKKMASLDDSDKTVRLFTTLAVCDAIAEFVGGSVTARLMEIVRRPGHASDE